MDRSRQPHLGKKEEHQWVSDSLVISPSVPLNHINEMGTNQVGIIGITAAAPARPRFFSVDGQAIVDNGHQGTPSQPRHGQMCPGQVASAFYPKFWPSFFINLTHNKVTLEFIQWNFLDLTHLGTHCTSSCTQQLGCLRKIILDGSYIVSLPKDTSFLPKLY